MSLTRVPDGQIATIVTSLQMTERPKPRPAPASRLGLRLDRWRAPSPERYRTLFRRVGAPWLWFSRLVMSDEALTAIIHDAGIEIYAVTDRPRDRDRAARARFPRSRDMRALVPRARPRTRRQGRGALADGAGARARLAQGRARMWVHTCTLDHPSALGFYRAQGFVPFARAVETFADPRLAGILPLDAAPQIPLIGSPVAASSVR